MTGILAMMVACGTPEGAPTPAAPPPSTASTAPAAPAPRVAPSPDATRAPARVNLNTATKEQLEAIPGITPHLVHEFEEYRPYVSIQQFRREIGKYIPEDRVAAFEPHVYVPIDPNQCDAATLMQIEGVDEAAAEALIAGRPYADAAEFATALSEHVDESVARTTAGHLLTGL